MQDNNSYRPPASSLLSGASSSKPPLRSFTRRFMVALLWALPIFMIISFSNSPVKEWPGLAAGSSFIALVSALVAMLIPTRFKSIYVTAGILAGFGLVVFSASH